MTTASVELWGTRIGAVTWDRTRQLGIFEYSPEFLGSGIEVSPLVMPLSAGAKVYLDLAYRSFKGLPGLLADSLPDKFGNALINAWLAGQGRDATLFNPVERLCYTGSRGMGALEFQPALSPSATSEQHIQIDQLVALSNRVLDERIALHGRFDGKQDQSAIENILRVGTSAGGARAKAILAWNEQTGEFRSGQVSQQDGFTQWLIKFDGVDGNSDKELSDPQGFSRIEYAYHLMAKDVGITMMPCRLHEEGGRAHFMTQRFDRTVSGEKLHYQSLGALMHYDFNDAGAHSYEQALMAIKRLELPPEDISQQIKRAFFNVIARNQDDHVKNIGFVMNKKGQWRLSPAFDVAYSYNPSGDWTSQHQMSINGKRDHFTKEDLQTLASLGGMKAAPASRMIEQVREVIAEWQHYANKAGVFDEHVPMVSKALRIDDFKQASRAMPAPQM